MTATVLAVESNPQIDGQALRSWSCSAQPQGSITHPNQLSANCDDWIPAIVPGTVAGALDSAGRWDFDQPTDLDACDWWFRTTFTLPAQVDPSSSHLCFDGLATLAEVWLNGEPLLTTDNMFRSYRVAVSSRLQASNALVIGFRSLAAALRQKRPRPRWKTNLVQQQQLRWYRTSLLGRIPGWAPCAPTIGPWRDVRLETAPAPARNVHLASRLDAGTGVVVLRADIFTATEPTRATLRVGAWEAELDWQPIEAGWTLAGELRVPSAPVWWPHTHGEATLLDCQLTVDTEEGSSCSSLGKIGFRTLQVHSEDGFALRVNGEPVFCRGACWTVSNLLSPDSTEESLRRDLQLARAAGINMLRIGGTMNYESDCFYNLCDELGILVWQDFMFANMDYPVTDAAFHENILAEATEQLKRLARHPCVSIYCGNSEIEQQAAMLGLTRDAWRSDWFGRELFELCASHHPETFYVPSTPTGGTLPFHVSSGITHYYGLGAYLRSPVELRKADVKFTSECLGFANVPEPQTVFAVTGGALPAIHDPRWKRRVPRDTGAGWDFDDVRDHYLRELYGVDPVQLRSWDMPRYLQLSRTASGEIMADAFAEWRSAHSNNRGGLVWFYKDLWPGAGWGIVDATGLPKAAYYFLKRVWNNRQLTLTDEGLNGLHLHLINETADAISGTVDVSLLKEPHTVVASRQVAVTVDPRSQQLLNAEEILGRFHDISYAYRFGPPQHDIVVATWFDDRHNVLSEAFHFVRRNVATMGSVDAVHASAERLGDGTYAVTLRSEHFLHSVRLHAEGFLPDDNYFHLPPHRSKRVTFQAIASQGPNFRASLEALNLNVEISIPATRATS